jgi:hypothetical protein
MPKTFLIAAVVGVACGTSAIAQEGISFPTPAMQMSSLPDTTNQSAPITPYPVMPDRVYSSPPIQPLAAPLSTPVEQRLSEIERRLALQEQAPAPVYPGMPVNGMPPADSPYMCGEPRSGDWMFEVEIGPSSLHLAGPDFGKFDRSGVSTALNIGYEWATGYGIRAQLWGFGQSVDDARDDVEVGAATFDLDLYKKIYVDYTELVVGAGSRGAELNFRSTADDTHSKFAGGGLNVFAEWYHPISVGQCYEIAFIGLGRMSLLQGEWRDTTGTLVDNTNDDMMTILEGSFGLEYRRRFGRLQDKYWYISVSPDIQQWQSQWMTANVGSSAGFVATNINFGVAW